MLKSTSVETFKAYAEQIFKYSESREKAIASLCSNVEINGHVFSIQYKDNFTVSYIGSGKDPSTDPLGMTTKATAEEIQKVLRDLIVTNMGPAPKDETGWLGGASGDDTPPPPQPPKPDDAGAVGGVEIPPPFVRSPIDLSDAEPDLLAALRGMSFAAQADIIQNWPLFTPLDYSSMLDTTASGQEMPGDKPAKVGNIEVTSSMLKAMQVSFNTTAEFKEHAEHICKIPRTYSQDQIRYMLSGDITVQDIDFNVDWEGNNPKVKILGTPKHLKKKAEEIRQELTRILEQAISDKPSTSSKGASAKP